MLRMPRSLARWWWLPLPLLPPFACGQAWSIPNRRHACRGPSRFFFFGWQRRFGIFADKIIFYFLKSSEQTIQNKYSSPLKIIYLYFQHEIITLWTYINSVHKSTFISSSVLIHKKRNESEIRVASNFDGARKIGTTFDINQSLSHPTTPIST